MLILSLLTTLSWSAEGMKTDKGTWNLGGNATVTVFGHTDDNDPGVQLNLSPNVGFFVLDNFEVFGGIDLGIGITSDVIGFHSSIGARLYFLDGQAKPYILGAGRFGVISSDRDRDLTAGGTIGAGVNLGVNEHVGIDLGIRTHLDAIDDRLYWSIPIGWMGMQIALP